LANLLISGLLKFGSLGLAVLVAFGAGMLYQRNLDISAENRALIEWAENTKQLEDTYANMLARLPTDKGKPATVVSDAIDGLPVTPKRKPEL